jgi:hypothetical protein
MTLDIVVFPTKNSKKGKKAKEYPQKVFIRTSVCRIPIHLNHEKGEAGFPENEIQIYQSGGISLRLV